MNKFNLNQITEKKLVSLSQFKQRDVELFRSSDQNQTAIYFTEYEYEERKTAKAYFEILRFGSKGGDHQIYIRFPNTDYFIEMYGDGFGSGRGDMKTITGINVFENKPFTIFLHNNNLILLLGEPHKMPEFNFMTRVAKYNKGNKFDNPYPSETFVNCEEIEKALLMNYLQIPDNIREIEYCFKTKEEKPKFFVVDFPAYNFKHDNHRFFVIDNEVVKEFKIKDFTRYRDGGTTIITVIDENQNEHKFFSPTPLHTNTLCEKWDETELIKVTEEEKSKLINLLKIKTRCLN